MPPLTHAESKPAAQSSLPAVRAEKYVLPNGMEVILHEDHAAPVVAVFIMYHVGSKNERPGRTGFAHLFEHLMFQGSQNNDRDYFAPLQKIGAEFNGYTTPDVTGYFELVPRNALELALWMESDRLGFLLPAITQQKLDTQRDVVKNEKRQRYDNQPYGNVGTHLAAAGYPPNHPYSWTTIGSMEDLTAASLEDVKDFFRTFYTPNNAALCLVGDFDSAEAKRLVEKYFGPIPPGPEPPRIEEWPVVLAGVKRVKTYDRIQLPRLVMAWHTVPRYHEDEAALQILARIMSASQSSRLDRVLVYEKQIAQSVSFSQDSQEIAGALELIATARPGHTLEEIEAAATSELAKIKTAPPSAEEVARAKNGIEAHFIRDFQGALNKAGKFHYYNLYRGDPNYAEQDLARYMKVTPEDVQRVAAKYMTDNYVHLTVEPIPPLAASTPPDTQQLDRGKEPSLGAQPSVKIPTVQKFTLSNGLEVRLVERHNLPLVNFNLVIKAGSFANPIDKPGLASMAAALMRQGTARRSALQLDEELEGMGTEFNIAANWTTTDVTMQALTKHLDASLDIFADVLLHPAFAQEELDRLRKSRLAVLIQQRSEPDSILWKAFAKSLYGPKHPYSAPADGTEESLPLITREDLQRFHQTYLRPNNAALVVVGDVTAETLRAKLENALAEWKPAKVAAHELPAATDVQRAVVLGDKPGAAQSVIAVGRLGFERKSPDYFPLMVTNALFGGTYMSRLNLNLRQDKGYTYGARSWFDFRRGNSPFIAYAPVNSAVTKEAVAEVVKELQGIVADKPITPEELQYAKDSLARSFLRRFETNGQVAEQLGGLVRWELPDDYLEKFVGNVQAVTLDDVRRVAKKYFDPSQMTVFVVGDCQSIEPKLKELGLGEIKAVDFRGDPAAKN